MNALIRYIYDLRDQEGMPFHFRRKEENGKTLWFVYYGYHVIAYRATQATATHAVEVAANVHHAIFDRKLRQAS